MKDECNNTWTYIDDLIIKKVDRELKEGHSIKFIIEKLIISENYFRESINSEGKAISRKEIMSEYIESGKKIIKYLKSIEDIFVYNGEGILKYFQP